MKQDLIEMLDKLNESEIAYLYAFVLALFFNN